MRFIKYAVSYSVVVMRWESLYAAAAWRQSIPEIDYNEWMYSSFNGIKNLIDLFHCPNHWSLNSQRGVSPYILEKWNKHSFVQFSVPFYLLILHLV